MKRSIKEVALLIIQPILMTAPPSTASADTSSSLRRTLQRPRKLIDGTEACSSCPSPTHQCIGRSVSDEVCSPCASGETFWPCNVESECWCWDISQPRDPGDEDSTSVCKGCSGPTQSCIANQNSLVPADDESCAACSSGQKYWPCDTEGLCWCWDSTKPKKPPAPSSGLEVTTSGMEACDLFTEEMFNDFAPNNTFPYTYQGFCDAVADYNLYHEEKVFMMGSEEDQRNEIAAFLGNTAHESDDYEAGREYLACGDNKEVDGKVYCKPCTNDLYDWETNTCSQSMADLNSPYSEYCQSVFMPPEGCNCTTVTQVAEDGELAGYIDASKVFYGRGAIQLSWNYNYIKASYALTGSPDTFCDDPELVVSDPLYAWGSAIYFWMENEKEGDTCHKEALKHNFGGTLNVINGGLECPAYAGGWHHKAVKLRINRYCHASSLLILSELGSMSGCKGMDDSLEECLNDGSCPFCEQYGDGNYTSATLKSDAVESFTGSNETVVAESFGNETTDGQTTPTNMPMAVIDNDVLASPAVAFLSVPPTISGTASAPASITNDTSAGLTSIVPTTSNNAKSSLSPTPAESTIASLMSRTPTSVTTAMSSTPPTAAGAESSSGVPTSAVSSTNATSSAPTTAASENFSNDTAESLTETSAPSSVTLLQTAVPSPSLLTSEKSSDPTWSPSIVETVAPSFSPTTPAPTLGPCDGEPCPSMLCRSPWGFCGEGDGYCNDEAVWSPECTDNSSAPTPTTSSTNTQSATFDVSNYDPYDPEPSDPENSDPTKSPTLSSSVPKFEKPSGGKKPPPNKKPGLSSPEVSNGSEEAVIMETSVPTSAPAPMPSAVPVSLAPTQKPVLSPDDPAATYFCGEDWIDANKVCAIRCPSAKSEDCPGDQSCFAFTRCNEDPPTLAPTGAVTPELLGTTDEYDNAFMSNVTSPSPPSPNGTSSSPSMAEMATPSGQPVDDTASLSGCTGKPCEVSGECRSQFGFCGSSFIYCNDLSSWTLDNCGLFGTDRNGETVLCDADTNECPGGDRMIRNPDNNCEFFPCPVEDETDGTQFAFNAPASTPTLPELPKPTLPTITNPKKPDFNSLAFSFGSVKSNQTIDLGMAKPSKDPGKVVVVGNKDNVADDKDEIHESTNSSSSSEKGVNDLFSFNNYNNFSYEDWINGGCSIYLHRMLILFLSLIATLTL